MGDPIWKQDFWLCYSIEYALGQEFWESETLVWGRAAAASEGGISPQLLARRKFAATPFLQG